MPDSRFDRRRLPDGFAFREWRARDGWRHRAFAWAPEGPVRGALLFQTGRADHAEKYLEAYAHFVGRGWTVEGFDWRGQGGSRRSAPIAVPGLATGAPSWRWVAAALAVPGAVARMPLGRVAVPVLLLAAGRDALVDPRATAAAAARLGAGRLVTIAGARHEMLREADAFRDPALAAIDAFLDEAAA